MDFIPILSWVMRFSLAYEYLYVQDWVVSWVSLEQVFLDILSFFFCFHRYDMSKAGDMRLRLSSIVL